MRVIENQIAETTHSPTKELLRDVHTAIINIAPERAAEFHKKFDSFTIEYLDDDEFIANVRNESKHIKLSTGAMELLWVLAYVHFQYYYKILQKIGCETETEVRGEQLAQIQPAIELLEWVMNRHLKLLEWKQNGGTKPERNLWPEKLPSPLSSKNDEDDEAVASEFTRGAVAALIHHELAHIALGHSGKSEIDPEKDADAHSWDWILGSNNTGGDAAELKRILMLIHAALVGVAVDIRLNRNTLIGHPRNIDRLANLLGRFDLDSNDLAYAFCLTILQFHTGFTAHSFRTPGVEYASFHKAFEAIADHISKFETQTE